MSREAVSTTTLIKGLAACAVVAASLGTLCFTEYPRKEALAFTPGSYTGSAQGMESEVTVTITVDEAAITEVSLDVSGETQGLGAATGDELAAQILAAQCDQIDGVAGCTVTSDAAKAALNAALEEAAM
ncbi:MAG: FMN-binding protein [Lachnospiraceae bacterium]|nr:FMN-binding protein [Lachnospiraceae bacterium]